ncbi:MAG: glycosyltransferase [Gallionella sp.]|nr:glycosyltransferase [Gallionella sp.]
MEVENPNLIKPKFSVIVLVFHRTPELVQMARDCVASVKRSSKDYELIIVDNGSTEQYPWDEECDTYIRFNKNMGISHGWNTGLRVSRGKYKVLLGDDTLVRTGGLEAMQEAMDMPNAGMVNPHVENLPPGVGIVEDYKWPSGSCFMLTQKVIDRVGYFDQDTYFPCNFEDVDYWARLLRAGFKIYKNHSMTIQHKEGQTVHSADLSSHYNRLREAFKKKHGFNAEFVFMGSQPFPF